MHVDTASEKICSDQDSRRSRAEFLHNKISLTLVHVSMHSRDGKITLAEFVGKPVHLLTGIAEDDGLGNGDGLIEIGEGVQFPVLFLDCDIKLLDTFQGKFSLLDQDAHWIAHEFGGNLQHVLRHSSGKKNDLGGLRQELEDIVDLLGEPALGNSQNSLHH